MNLSKFVCLVLGALGMSGVAGAVPGFVDRELLIKVKEGMESSVPIGVASVGASQTGNYPQISWIRVKYASGKTMTRAMTEFRRMNWVDKVEKNLIYLPTAMPNDPFTNQQWHLDRINLPLAWDWETGLTDIKIAIIDTGVDINHPDLAANITPGRDVMDDDGDPSPAPGADHGTHVAGTASAATNNATGVAGVGYDCKIMGIRAGDFFFTGADLLEAITWASDNDANVINMSLGGGAPSQAMQDAVTYANSKNVIVICAAGNNGSTAKFYPAAYPGCMAVASSDPDDSRSGFSNYGNWVHVAAPGNNIYATYPNNQYGFSSGTSMASPVVAGLAGLVWSRGGESQSWTRVFDIIKDNCTPVPGNYTIHGRVDANQAVQATTIVQTTMMEILSISMFTGASEAGTLDDVTSEDGDFYAVITSVQGRQGSLGGVEMTALLDRPLAELFDFRFNFTMKSSIRCTGMMWLWNYQQNRWDFIKAIPVKTTNTNAQFRVSNMNRYVDVDGTVTMRLRGHNAAGRAGGSIPFTFLIDFANMQASYEVQP